jgi:pimeloyl-ACP methyl ester carboxylesterase
MTADGSAAYAAAAHYRRVAGPPGGDRVPVLMLHGLGGDLDQLWPYAGGDQSRLRLAPDLRAHGGTDLIGTDSAFTFDGMADDVMALLDRLELPSVIVVGMSMGAAIAVRMALREPGRIRGLVLIRPAWLDRPRPANLEPLVAVGELLRSAGRKDGRERFAASAHFRRIRDESPAAAASLLGQFDAPLADERAGRLIAMPASTPFGALAELRRIEVATAVVAAPGDPQHPAEFASAWAGQIPDAQLSVVPRRDTDPDGYHRAISAVVAARITFGLDAGRDDRGGC